MMRGLIGAVGPRWFASTATTALVLALGRIVPASASDLLGLYAGAAFGQTDVRANEVYFPVPQSNGIPLGFSEHATGWKVLAGIRPISLIGVELEYADFGHPSALTPAPASFSNIFSNLLGIRADAHPTATSLSGLLYAPVPLPLLDLYGKVGISQLRTDVHAAVVCTTVNCPPTIPFPPLARYEATTNFAYGAGAQLKLSALAVRLEYERLSAGGGDPALLSIGVAWAF
jgi:outer membrane protein with beta-barrel domain